MALVYTHKEGFGQDQVSRRITYSTFLRIAVLSARTLAHRSVPLMSRRELSNPYHPLRLEDLIGCFDRACIVQ